MSKQRATEHNNNDVIDVDDDDEDEDVQFVGIVRPMTTIDLCLSPSTSAAAAAAAAGGTLARASGGDPHQDPSSPAVTTPPGVVSAPTTPDAAGKSINVEAATTTSGEDSSLPLAAAGALECPICLQTCIHPARLPCGHIFCFLCVKGVAYKNRRCAMCRREIPAEFLDHPQLVNGIEDICTTRATEDGYQWYYEGRNGGWWAYDPRTNEDIEIAYAGYLRYKTAKPPIIPEDHNPANPIRPPPEPTEPAVTEPMSSILGAAPGNAAPSSFTESSIELNADDSEDETIEMEDEDRDSIFGDDAFDYDASAEDDWQSSASDDLSEIGPHAGRLHQQICGEMYVIDFLKMKQYPRSSPDRRRNIMRCKSTDAVPGVTKGVAGLSKHLRYK
ncbi:E3 ubiquitin-protein ligase rnf146 isoform X2 [Drosophila serrata]|uniref:E3 ubiquitin-protein ligase rnf146 isoform X2 n=1 Tax=Drosophila serrata TaxID=7274 RepID=UPI000A1D289A|nr:E3 ubiquitin-protein ligase rnf146 isoform X2 [Drosophila serrata]